jgi:periplasmic protein TonB
MAAVSARGMVWHGGNRHALEYAVAASLALHTLALLFLPALPSMATRPVRAQPPLEARLVPAQRVEPPRPPPPPEVETRPQPRQALRPAPPKPRPARKLMIKRPQPAAEPARAPVVAPPPQPPAPVARPVPAAPAAPPVTAPPPVRRAPAPDTASLVERYRAAIIEQAKRYKRYPRFARDNGWEGRVNVRMAIAPDGAIAALRVTHGTGFQILDDQALEMVRSAKQDAAIPEGLRGRTYSVDIPVVFNLRDADR